MNRAFPRLESRQHRAHDDVVKLLGKDEDMKPMPAATHPRPTNKNEEIN